MLRYSLKNVANKDIPSTLVYFKKMQQAQRRYNNLADQILDLQNLQEKESRFVSEYWSILKGYGLDYDNGIG